MAIDGKDDITALQADLTDQLFGGTLAQLIALIISLSHRLQPQLTDDGLALYSQVFVAAFTDGLLLWRRRRRLSPCGLNLTNTAQRAVGPTQGFQASGPTQNDPVRQLAGRC